MMRVDLRVSVRIQLRRIRAATSAGAAVSEDCLSSRSLRASSAAAAPETRSVQRGLSAQLYTHASPIIPFDNAVGAFS